MLLKYFINKCIYYGEVATLGWNKTPFHCCCRPRTYTHKPLYIFEPGLSGRDVTWPIIIARIITATLLG